MGNLEVKIPFITEQGNEYTLEFAINKDIPDVSIPIPIVEISIILEKRVTNTNSFRVFNYIIEEIRSYLSNHDVILFYYCDGGNLYYRSNNKRKFTSPQHFRSVFFNTLFEKASTSLLIENQVITDEIHGNHYFSFIYNEKYKSYIQTLLEELKDLENK